MQDSKNAGKYAYLNAGIVPELPDFVGLLFKKTRDDVKYIYYYYFMNLIVGLF